MNRFFYILALSMMLAAPARATPLIADLSSYRIDIDASFSGTRLFLFGVRNEGGDIVIVVRGPNRDFVVRKKEEIAGVWINRDRLRFWNVPQFYALAASAPLPALDRTGAFAELNIGQERLIHLPRDPDARRRHEPFAQAFLEHQRAQLLYRSAPEPVGFMGETLFKTAIDFPSNIPSGDYTAEIYLVNEGHIVGMQSMPIRVVKTGFDAFIYNYAHRSPILYGITAVVLALAAGWIAGRMFEKS